GEGAGGGTKDKRGGALVLPSSVVRTRWRGRACQNRITRWAVVGDRRSKSAWMASTSWLDVRAPPGRTMMMALVIDQSQPADLQRMRTGSGRSAVTSRFTTSIGTGP